MKSILPSGKNTGNDKEEDGDEDSKVKIEEEEGSVMVVDGDFLDLLCLEKVLQGTAPALTVGTTMLMPNMK
ncbi:hypothetical protein C0995_015897 [Termitomyces sp. Mi166|nr:hypothetical protein C0995_015897 [Termitomyces sp. Mi166\